jgi:eukaryotic-like serine/threonine-protein kinase
MGEATTVVSARRQSDPKRLGQLLRGELDWIVMKALEKDRTRRYETAAAFAADIQRYLHDEPVLACPPSAWYRFGKMARRNKGTLVAAALVSLALVIGSVISLWQAIRATEALSSKEEALNSKQAALVALGQEQQATKRELGRAQAAEEQATRELFEALVAEARANRLSRRIGQRFRTLEIVDRANRIGRQLQLPPERFLELRNEAIAALALPDLRVAKEWQTPAGSWVVFDAKMERYARTDRAGTVYVRRAGDGAELWRLPNYSHGELGLSFSANGEYLAIEDRTRKRLHVWRLTGPAPTRILDEPAEVHSHFSPDSRQVAVQQPDGTIGIFDLASKTRVQQLPPIPLWSRLAFHPDGGKLASTSGNSVQVHALAAGQLLWQNKQAADWLEWHPDGNSLAVGSDDVIAHLDAASGKQVGNMNGIPGGGVTFAFNATGDLLASRGWSGIVRLWDPRTCRQIFSVPAHTEVFRFSPDGRFLAATDNHNQLGIWEVAAGSEYRTLTANPMKGNRAFMNVAVNGDGRLVAAGGASACACLWDLPSGKELALLEDSGGYNLAAFAPRRTEKQEESLLTRGANGFLRRSIHIEPETATVNLGDPEKLPVPGRFYRFALSRDGKVLAAAQGDGAVVWHTDEAGPLLELRGHDDVRGIAVSPDGQWVLTGRFSYPRGIKVWQARGGKFEFVRDLPGNHTWAVFSPDGKRILTSGPDDTPVIRRWEVGRWTELPFAEPLEGKCPAFSPDGKRIVLESGAGSTRLVDAETGTEYARLEDPNQDRATQYAFTPDGTKLLAASDDGFCVHVWDLQAIRRQLGQMKLDW